MNDIKQRGRSVDAVRGIAILMVVLGHTITGVTKYYTTGAVYNVIWSLQMPLFFLISGYCIKYSRAISSGKDYFRYIAKRTVAYMLPWCVWTFLIRGVLFGQNSFLDVGDLLYNMDRGYWFLVSLWTLTLIYGTARFLSGRIVRKDGAASVTVTLVLFIVLTGILALIGCFAGMSFFSIRLTLYYSPVFLAGYLYSIAEPHITGGLVRVRDAAAALAAVAYALLMLNFNLCELTDSLPHIAIRFTVSLCGCAALFAAVRRFKRPLRLLSLVGEHSLEIYLIHYLILTPIKTHLQPSGSIGALGLVSLDFVLTLAATAAVIFVLGSSRVIQFVLFGKKKHASESIDRRNGTL